MILITQKVQNAILEILLKHWIFVAIFFSMILHLRAKTPLTYYFNDLIP